MNKKELTKKLLRVIVILTLCLILIVSSFFCVFSVFYPVKYKKIIKNECQNYNLDEILVFSIINAESRFVPTKTSNKGAMGLMQIMPSTAIFIASELEIENFEVNSLYNPDINIKFGVFYIDYLSKKFDTIEQIVCAYNAGEHNVRSWLNDKTYSNDGINLLDIPFKETKNYLEKVQKNYKIYKKIV